ncbi:hypothetical protein SOVF_007020, partial [Spinacia oleracea]
MLGTRDEAEIERLRGCLHGKSATTKLSKLDRGDKVLHAFYMEFSPSIEVDNPQLVAWSDSIAESLELDLKDIAKKHVVNKWTRRAQLWGLLYEP